MSGRTDLAERAALSLIAADAKFVLNLVRNPRLERIRPTAVMALMPFTSAFVYESIRHVKRGNPEALPELRSHQELLRASRMRMKLLEGDPRTLEIVLADADELVATVKDLFMREHRGILGPLKRLLQDDLGVHFIGSEPVCTLHVALLNTGIPNSTPSALSWDDLGPYLKDTARGLGSDAAEVLSELGIFDEVDVASYAVEDTSEPPLAPPGFRDLKSERFYGSMTQRTAPGRHGIGVVLTSILSQVRTARTILPIVAGRNEVAAFKIGLVSLFHAALSLIWLLGRNQSSSLLHEDANREIKAILSDGSVRRVRKEHTLRNHLFHYDLNETTNKRIAPSLVPDLPLCGLVEAHTAGRSLADVAADVEVGLERVSEGLGSLLPQPLTSQGTL